MKYNNLPGTSLKVSEISLGTMMFGAQTGEADSLSILDFAHEQGVNFWDTANMYNQGESERIVGKALKGRREDVILATKVSYPMEGRMNSGGLSRRAILSALDASLSRLGTDYVDLYYLHSPDYETSIGESLDTMSTLVRSGKVRYVGVSNYAAWQVADMLAAADRHGYVAPVVTQNVYNMITRGVEQELVPFIRAHGLGMTVYNPVAGGFLTGKHRPGEPEAGTRFAFNENYRGRYWTEENFKAVEQLTAIAGKRGMGLLELAMKWAAGRPGVTSVISGVSRLSQLEQNVKALEGERLDEATLLECDGVWQSLAGNRFKYNR